MTTNELDGRALAEAAARAMGWQWIDYAGTIRGTAEDSWEWVPDMLWWLHERGRDGADLHTMSSRHWCRARLEYAHHEGSVAAQGTSLLEALQRLVVAVAAREVKHG
jgi:hypothetical protein